MTVQVTTLILQAGFAGLCVMLINMIRQELKDIRVELKANTEATNNLANKITEISIRKTI